MSGWDCITGDVYIMYHMYNKDQEGRMEEVPFVSNLRGARLLGLIRWVGDEYACAKFEKIGASCIHDGRQWNQRVGVNSVNGNDFASVVGNDVRSC